jgi:glycine dehydrogenase subunit 2
LKLIFEKSKKGSGSSVLPPCDVPAADISPAFARKLPARLPCLDENSLSRHYSALAKRSFGVNDGFYPLGSCTMKYNPKINEELAALPGFRDIHPLQPAHTVKGCLKLLDLASRYLREITGMDAMSFQPAAGAQGEFTGLLLFAAWHRSRGDAGRNTVIVPNSAHGTNPASAAMAGFRVRNIPSGPDGCVDLEALRAALGPDTAALMLTNPNTLGLFDPRILEITGLVHQAGGLCYYDGANLNAVMGITRPGDMGFDAVHLNLHKSFSTPHGGGGPGSGVVGCKDFLAPFLPLGAEIPGSPPEAAAAERALRLEGDGEARPRSIGRVRAFYGNFLVVVKAAAYLLSLGKEGIPAVAGDAVLNANYLMEKIRDRFPPAYPGPCMHEFVISLEELKRSRGVSALDLAKALQDKGMHPPTIYFPLIVHEAMMVEPTETESKETLDEAAAAFRSLYDEAREDPEKLRRSPLNTVIGRPDDVKAARQPVLRYTAP